MKEFLENEYNCIYETKLGENSMIFAAEMDAIINEDNKEHFVELKTSKEINSFLD